MGVRLTGAAGVGFTVSSISLQTAPASSGSLLLASGSLRPAVTADGLAQASDSAGDSLNGQIVAVSAAAAATGGIAVGAAVVNNTLGTHNTLQLKAGPGDQAATLAAGQR